MPTFQMAVTATVVFVGLAANAYRVAHVPDANNLETAHATTAALAIGDKATAKSVDSSVVATRLPNRMADGRYAIRFVLSPDKQLCQKGKLNNFLFAVNARDIVCDNNAVLVTFSDVADDASADRKMAAVVQPLDEFTRNLNDGRL